MRTCIKAWMSLNLGQIPPLTMELAALEHLKNRCHHFFSVAIDPILFKFAGNEDRHNIRLLCAYSSLYFYIFLSLQVSTLKFFITFFSGTMRPRRLKLITHVVSGQMYHVYWNQAAAAYSSLYFFIFLSLQFSTLKYFVTLFLGTMRPRRLKLGTHLDSGQMYHVYQNQAAALIHPFISSFLFLSSFQHWNFSSLFSGTVRPRRLKLGTHIDNGQMYQVYWNQAAAAYLSHYAFFFLSNFQTLKIFVTLFSGTVRPRRLKIGTHMDNGWIYCVCQNQASAAYSSHYFFIFISLQLSNIKKFCHIFLRNWEV